MLGKDGKGSLVEQPTDGNRVSGIHAMTVLSLMVVYIVQSFHQPLTRLFLYNHCFALKAVIFAVLNGTVLHETLCIKKGIGLDCQYTRMD